MVSSYVRQGRPGCRDLLARPGHGGHPPVLGARLRQYPVLLNALGYLGLLAALPLPIPQLARFRPITRWALVDYAALTIALWFLMAVPTVTSATSTRPSRWP